MENKSNKGALAILGIIICLFLASCMTNRKGELTEKGKNFISQHCKGEDSVSHTDNTIISFDTIKIPYPVQGPIQYLENPCHVYCDSLGNLRPFLFEKKTNGITGTIKSVGNSIAFDCKEDSMKYIIEKQMQTINDLKKTKTVIKEPCNKEHISGTHWMFIRLGQILSGFIILQCLIRIITVAWPITKPFLSWAYIFKL